VGALAVDVDVAPLVVAVPTADVVPDAGIMISCPEISIASAESPLAEASVAGDIPLAAATAESVSPG
jgi:hypothetical protein